MDALTPLLQDLRLQDGYYCWSELRAPWGASFPASPWCSFEYVIEGRGWITISGQEKLLEAGAFCLIPGGRPYAVANPSTAPCIPFEELPFERLGQGMLQLRMGGKGALAVSICGGARLVGTGAHHLARNLPDSFLIQARDRGPQDWLRPILDAIAMEVNTRRMGTPAVLTRLIEVLILQTIRAWAESTAGNDQGWLGALRDPQIGHALALMHADPGIAWDLSRLAQAIGTSRTVFAERFARKVGCTPMLYLTRWRMDLASQWLEDERITVAEVAERLAYGSEAAFSRAFKRHSGVAPSCLRRNSQRTKDRWRPDAWPGNR